jgi:hypothetical protein
VGVEGLKLPGSAGEFDLPVVGALGTVVLEVKYWAGQIVCGHGRHAWARQRRGVIETLRDLVRQLEGELAALTAFWQRRGYTVSRALADTESGFGSNMATSSAGAIGYG